MSRMYDKETARHGDVYEASESGENFNPFIVICHNTTMSWAFSIDKAIEYSKDGTSGGWNVPSNVGKFLYNVFDEDEQ